MFLSSFQDGNSFSFGLRGGVSAIEAELRHMANFSGNDIEVEAEGGCIILTGSVDSSVDFYRALNVATDIAGADKVIFRVSQV